MKLYAICSRCGGVGLYSGGKYACRNCGHTWAPPKYRNKKTVVGDDTFDSKWEAERWSTLRLLEQAGEIKDLQRQVAFPLHVNGIVIGKYIADFVYDHDGQQVVEDAKGVQTPMFRWKSKHFSAEYGQSIRLVHK